MCEFTHQSVSPLVWLLSLYMTASVCLSAVCLSFSVNLLIHLVWRDSLSVFLLVCLSAWPTEAYMPFSVYLFSSLLSISHIASTIFGLSYCQFIRLTYARICMYVRPSVCLSPCLCLLVYFTGSVCLPVGQSVCVSVCPYVCLSVCVINPPPLPFSGVLHFISSSIMPVNTTYHILTGSKFLYWSIKACIRSSNPSA